MTLASGVFAAFLILGIAGTAIATRLAWQEDGTAAAVKAAAVMTVSLAAYAAVCLWLGYGPGAQFLAAGASLIPLRAGRRYLPAAIGGHLGGNS